MYQPEMDWIWKSILAIIIIMAVGVMGFVLYLGFSAQPFECPSNYQTILDQNGRIDQCIEIVE